MIKDFFKSLFKINRETKIFIGIIILLVIIGAIVKSTEPFCAFGIIGDCTTEAKTEVVDITEQLQSIDQSIRQKIDQSCLSANSASNIINVIDSTLVNADISQQNILKNICALKSAFEADVNTEAQNKVAAVIAQHAKSTGGFLGAPANSESVTKSITDSKTFIDNSMVLESVKRCMNQVQFENVVNIINSSVTNTSIKQLNDQFFECLASDINTAQLAAEAKAESDKQIQQSAEAEGNDLIKSLFQGIGMWFIIPIAIVAIFFLFFSSKTISDNPELGKSLLEAYASSKAIQSS
jgi:hypothetical protein